MDYSEDMLKENLTKWRQVETCYFELIHANNQNQDQIKASWSSNVVMKQGDSINMVANYLEYSGKTQLAYAKGDVVLTEPQSVLSTDKLHFDRNKQLAYYDTKGKVVRDSSGTITSQIGRYYMPYKTRV